MTTKLSKITDPIKRGEYVHEKIDKEISEFLSNSEVNRLVQCKKGCSACCHSQVAITEEEADLLVKRVDEGVEINIERLYLQAQAGNSASEFFKLSYDERRCVFLNDRGLCSVYEDRPSVCRTNYVVSDPRQCEIRAGETPSVQLLNTYSADSWVYSFFNLGKNNGALASLVKNKLIGRKKIKQALFPWVSKS